MPDYIPWQEAIIIIGCHKQILFNAITDGRIDSIRVPQPIKGTPFRYVSRSQAIEWAARKANSEAQTHISCSHAARLLHACRRTLEKRINAASLLPVPGVIKGKNVNLYAIADLEKLIGRTLDQARAERDKTNARRRKRKPRSCTRGHEIQNAPIKPAAPDEHTLTLAERVQWWLKENRAVRRRVFGSCTLPNVKSCARVAEGYTPARGTRPTVPRRQKIA